MPGKPSRRDRKRRGTAAPERRPRPAPPVSPGRIVRAARPDSPTAERDDSAAARGVAERPVVAQQQPAATTAARARGVGALRRGATASARALEAQREERVRRDSIKDLRSIAIAAVVTTAALVTVATLL